MIDKQKTIKADLHVHVDKNITKEAIIKILTEAEANGVQALCMLEHNELHLYRKDSPFIDIIKNEGVEKYYTGKLITGCEYDCVIKNAPISKNGRDYNGNIVHIAVYGFNPYEFLKEDIYKEEIKYQNWERDIEKLFNKGKSLGLDMPPVTIFDYNGIHHVKQLYNYIMANEERKEKFIGKFIEAGLTEKEILGYMANDSSFIRNMFQNTYGKLHIDEDSILTIQQVIKLAQKYNAQTVIVHPAYMLPNDDLENYVDALCSMPRVDSFKPNFWGVEGTYMLNTVAETELTNKIAKTYNLEVTGGSDYQMFKNGKMYFLRDGRKFYYEPKPGFAIGQYVEKMGENTKLQINDDNMGAIDIIIPEQERNVGAIKVEKKVIDKIPSLQEIMGFDVSEK